jgi:hypothetical protein
MYTHTHAQTHAHKGMHARARPPPPPRKHANTHFHIAAGNLTSALSADRTVVRAVEAPLGNLVCDAMMWYIKVRPCQAVLGQFNGRMGHGDGGKALSGS